MPTLAISNVSAGNHDPRPRWPTVAAMLTALGCLSALAAGPVSRAETQHAVTSILAMAGHRDRE